jgi:hypothetical protein
MSTNIDCTSPANECTLKKWCDTINSGAELPPCCRYINSDRRLKKYYDRECQILNDLQKLAKTTSGSVRKDIQNIINRLGPMAGIMAGAAGAGKAAKLIPGAGEAAESMASLSFMGLFTLLFDPSGMGQFAAVMGALEGPKVLLAASKWLAKCKIPSLTDDMLDNLGKKGLTRGVGNLTKALCGGDEILSGEIASRFMGRMALEAVELFGKLVDLMGEIGLIMLFFQILGGTLDAIFESRWIPFNHELNGASVEQVVTNFNTQFSKTTISNYLTRGKWPVEYFADEWLAYTYPTGGCTPVTKEFLPNCEACKPGDTTPRCYFSTKMAHYSIEYLEKIGFNVYGEKITWSKKQYNSQHITSITQKHIDDNIEKMARILGGNNIIVDNWFAKYWAIILLGLALILIFILKIK